MSAAEPVIAEFIEAPNSGGDWPKVLLVVHLTISPEVAGAARGVVRNWNAAHAAGRDTGSTQYVVDAAEIIQSVRETAYAWSAGTTANRWGIHVEHCGYLQSVREWRDGYSTAELHLSAALFAYLARKYGIPIRRLTPDQVRAAVASGDPAQGGFCGHVDITAAFPGETTHTDPGKFFPWDLFLRLVSEAYDAQEGDPMAQYEQQLNDLQTTLAGVQATLDKVLANENRRDKAQRVRTQKLLGKVNDLIRHGAKAADLDSLRDDLVAALVEDD